MALNGLLCADMPLRIYTLTHSTISDADTKDAVASATVLLLKPDTLHMSHCKLRVGLVAVVVTVNV